LGKVPSLNVNSNKYNTVFIGLKAQLAVLRKRIHDRLLKRLKSGMLEEARKLHRDGLSWKRMEELGLEYRYQALYLQKKICKEEMVTQLETAIWHYAKRQMTWFKRDKRIRWVEVGEVDQRQIVENFLANHKIDMRGNKVVV
ncbi:MAG: tRNA dimethylallyltransferase, partial [Candidatus Paceibacterota bacterium]